MSKFSCEYCGGLIDTEINKECPQCGGSYANNAQFLQLQKRENEIREKKSALDVVERQEQLRRARMENDSYRQTMETTHKNARMVSKIIWIPFVVVIVIIIAVGTMKFIQTMYSDILFFNKMGPYAPTQSEKVRAESVSEETEPTYVESTAGFDEYAFDGVLSVKVDECKEIDSRYKILDNHKPAVIHLVVDNATDESVFFNYKIVVLADGAVVSRPQGSYNYKEIGHGEIPDHAKMDGYVLYQIPVTAEEIEVRAGDYITIKFPNPLKIEE